MLDKDETHRCMLLGCIGNDSYGKRIEEALAKAGVKPVLEVNDQHQSSRCGVGIHLKERCLIPDIRASSKLSMEFVQKNLDIVASADILFIEGYFVIERYEIVKFLASHFTSLGKKIVFTLSATFMVDNFPDKMLEISNQSHLVFCNDEEAIAFSKIKSDDFEEISVAIHQMLQPLDRLLIITCGSKPVVISKYDYKENRLDFILKTSVYPVDSTEIVDTNGCGDSFVGGFLSQYIKGASLEKCARAGNWAASVIIKHVGCTYSDNLKLPKFK
jgi:adenosine kinase